MQYLSRPMIESIHHILYGLISYILKTTSFGKVVSD